MEIDNMSTGTIKEYLKERENKGDKEFRGLGYTFIVDEYGYIKVKNHNLVIIESLCNSLKALSEAVDLAKKRRGMI